MRVICCYTSAVHPRAMAALTRFAPEAELIKTTGLFGYNKTIESHWTGESDLVVIEGDKEITAEVLPSFEACNSHWCSFAYDNFPPPLTGRIETGLGCTKYSAKAQQVIKPAEFICPDVSWEPCIHCDSKGCWSNLDSRIARALIRHGADRPHVHGKVLHHHLYDDAWAVRFEAELAWVKGKFSEMKIEPEVYQPVGEELK